MDWEFGHLRNYSHGIEEITDFDIDFDDKKRSYLTVKSDVERIKELGEKYRYCKLSAPMAISSKDEIEKSRYLKDFNFDELKRLKSKFDDDN